MPIDTYDALIVGARVAGSVIAALLGDAGYRVLLVDRATFPSPTLSTHFFRGSKTLAVLDRLDILESVLALGSPPLLWQYWYMNGAEQGAQLPYSPTEIGPIDYCLSVRRAPLDFILLQRARRSPTVEFLEQTRATSLV